jgi:CheY-like chemotaxis protein
LRYINYDYGYELAIDTANTGDKALMLCNNKIYNLVFMDVDLDGEDGCYVSGNILNTKLNRNVKIVAVTANIKSIQTDRDNKFNIFDDVILKPFNNKDIYNVIVKFLNTE